MRDRRGCEGVACEHQLGRQPLHLYTYLWTKPELLNDHCGRFRFVLTDTVLFKHQKPTRWLFTSHQDKGKILSKHKKHLTANSVLQEFLAPKLSPSPPMHEDERILATYTYLERSSCSGEMVMVVEHLNQAALSHLLLVRDKPSESVLQRFIPTKSGFNHTIQVVYTPEICTVRKCVNPNMISDLKFSPLQRTVTFEDQDLADRSRDVSSKETRKQIEQMSTEISTHLQKIVGKEMVRNVSYFKIGLDNRIYLLWSTMLSFEHASKAFAKNHKLSLSTHEKHIYDISNYALVCRSQQLLGAHAQLRCCPNCKQMLPRSQVSFVVTYKSIMHLFEAEHSKKDYPIDLDRIPKLIKNAVGSMPFDRFEQLKRTTAFQYQIIQMCHPCAQTINTAAMKQSQPESPPPRKASLMQTKDSNVSLENATAHQLFWAKVDREEEALRGRQQPSKTEYRPSSANEVRILFRSTRLKKLKPALPSNQDPRLTADHSLPRITDGIGTFVAHNYDGSEFTVKMARHLQRRFGRPSTRYALAQCGIFPQGPSVSVSTLKTLGADSAVLAGVVSHWAALNFANGHEIDRSVIDIDALDGLLSARIYRFADMSDLEAGASRALTPQKQHDTRAPIRPVRPKSCSMASRSNRQARNSTPQLTDHQLGDSHGVPADSIRPDHQDQQQQPTRLRRVFNGVEYFVDVSAMQPSPNNANNPFCLHIQATEVYEGQERTRPMELMLNTEQILLLVGKSTSEQEDPLAALSSEEAMIRAVLEQLAIRNGALEYQDLIAMDDDGACPELTDDEWLVLQQTLAQS